MAYDEVAKKLAIKAIGTVESNLNYASINYNDPITVGFMQWYGTRASSLLRRIRTAAQPSVLFDKPDGGIASDYRTSIDDVLTKTAQGMQIAQGTSLGTMYISPTANFPMRGPGKLSFSVDVAVTQNMRIRTSFAMSSGVTGPTPPAIVQMTPADGFKTFVVNADFVGVANGYVQVVVNGYGATTSAAPLGQSFTVKNFKVFVPGTWVGVASSVEADLDAHPDTDTQFWTNRYLNAVEGESLKPVLLANKPIQNAVAIEDMEVYKDTAVRQGMDPENNTNAMLFFFVMYHQSPKRALSILGSAGPQSDLDRLLAAALNEPVLGKYRTRYNTAAAIIRSGDVSGIDDPPGTLPPPPPSEGDDGADDGLIRTPGDVSYVQKVGDQLHVRLRSGRTLVAVPTAAETWTMSQDGGSGADVPELPPVVPPSPTPEPGKGAELVAWMQGKLGRYNYSQGATRLKPEQNMYTDCSGLVYTAYQEITGINIGTYTGDQYTKGTLVVEGSKTIDESLLQPGDLIFYNWVTGRPTVDHVEMYVGGGQVCGHPGPGKGPTLKPVTWGINTARNYYVRRHL